MPSVALLEWQAGRAAALDEIEAAHRAIGGTGPGRRYATRQINFAYAVLLASQFRALPDAPHGMRNPAGCCGFTGLPTGGKSGVLVQPPARPG